MAIIVAPDTGYNSFLSVADADTFHTDRNTAAWLASDSASKAAALIRASDYIDANYLFDTDPVTDTVDPLLEKATAVMAVYALTATLTEPKSQADPKLEWKRLEGVGMTRTDYFGRLTDPYPAVTAILAPIATASRSSIVVGKLAR